MTKNMLETFVYSFFFLNQSYDIGCACGLFWYNYAVFHSGVIIVLMNSFWWWDDVHGGVTMSLQLSFFFSPSRYDIDNLFFIVNYYLLFALFIIDVFINYIIILTGIINSIKSMTISWICLAFIKTLMMPKHNFLYYKKFNPIHTR